ncbi:3'-5' exonuclease [Pseudomethylobacillus aquaticus]|uniref:3'-5' exonuclease n=1 Tax=Pseudomethylobacillus aquaticus TaxID=2676064 RepID=A0A3N0V589_9PROT|nr:3'-5' exonuclease [Pseudomethylobacillus aquaticus]ROH87967.1 3'-5' exonuclease [Pseudomethylobacillus aquaticus]
MSQNIAVFYDTETTGLPLFSEPSEDPRQPHIVQLAAIMVNLDTQQTLQSINMIIRPDGWVIEPELTAIHGISHEFAMDVGVSELVAVEALVDMVGARLRVAHNESFDARIIRIALKRYFQDEGKRSDAWKAGLSACTAKITTPIIKLPPTEKMVASGRRFNKTPNLTEAYQHFFGSTFDGAHTAMGDVIACRDVYFAARDIKVAA